MKKVKAQEVDMGGIPILQPLPVHGMHQLDPFLLVHHWKQTMEGGKHPSELGVPPHPHKGFSPVTCIFKGALRHLDSRGNDSIVRAGGTQWMFADGGIFHSERPDMQLAKEGGELELIQFWINSPAANKEDAPQYIPLSEEQTPTYTTDDQKVIAGVLTGDFHGVKGPIRPHSPMTIVRIRGEKGGSIKWHWPEGHKGGFYLLDGKVVLNGTEAEGQDLLALEEEDSGPVELEFHSDTRILMMAGKPIEEPLKTYGPFVMNSQREIMNALEEAQSGKWGEVREHWDTEEQAR